MEGCMTMNAQRLRLLLQDICSYARDCLEPSQSKTRQIACRQALADAIGQFSRSLDAMVYPDQRLIPAGRIGQNGIRACCRRIAEPDSRFVRCDLEFESLSRDLFRQIENGEAAVRSSTRKLRDWFCCRFRKIEIDEFDDICEAILQFCGCLSENQK
jgi:hypothetical protein